MGHIQFRQSVVHGIHHKHVDLKLNHHLHSFYQKNIIERTIQYIKDRIECFDDYFLLAKEKRNAN